MSRWSTSTARRSDPRPPSRRSRPRPVGCTRSATSAPLWRRNAPRRRLELNPKETRTMRVCHDEWTLDELLNDPLVTAVMRADGVDPRQLGEEFARIAEGQDASAE